MDPAEQPHDASPSIPTKPRTSGCACAKCGVCPAAYPNRVRSAKPVASVGVGSGASSRTNRGRRTPTARRRASRRWQKGRIVNKTEFIERIAQEAGVPEGEAQRHFGAFERVVAEALKGGDEVRITGFGKFSVRERKAREGRNPQTGEKMKIKASKVPAFSAGNALKQAI